MLPEITNFRDAGGLPSGSLRPGVIYRSAQLADLSVDTRKALHALDVRSVYDLRTEDEVIHAPDQVMDTLRITLLDVLADRPHSGAAAVASLVTAKDDGTTIDDINRAVSDGRGHELMIETYRHFVTLPSAHASYGALLSTLADDEGSSVIHCTAGKDRTGWAMALLQRLCGVSQDDVVIDYLASNAAMERAYRPMLDSFGDRGGDADSLADMIFVKPEYLDAPFALLERDHGGFGHYLRNTLGLDDGVLDRLRARLAG